MNYKQLVNDIKNLKWRNLSADELEELMILSAYAAIEFAESLRITLELYPESCGLKEMASGELNTNNLLFNDYNRTGNHADFLFHFIDKNSLIANRPEIRDAGNKYRYEVRKLKPEIRAMSIVSREHELPGIFREILKARNWSTPSLAAFRYYLEQHIYLDSKEGGHADLLSGYQVTDEVASFYRVRLEMYLCIPSLF